MSLQPEPVVMKDAAAPHEVGGSPLRPPRTSPGSGHHVGRLEARAVSGGQDVGASVSLNSVRNGRLDLVEFVDGSTYTGDWQDGMMHGQGTSTFPNGCRQVRHVRTNSELLPPVPARASGAM